jgi:O-antigen/teichoic acid export membrane protein
MVIKLYRQVINYLENKKNFILYSFFRFATQGLSLLTNIFIVRQLSVNDYGIYSISLTVIGFVVTFGFSWSSSTIVYYGSKEKTKKGNINKTFWARNIILFFSLISVTLVFFFFRNLINSYIGIEIAFVILFWIYIRVFGDYLKKYFLAVKKQILSTMLTFISRIIFLLFVIFIPINVELIIILYLLSEASVLFFVFKVNKNDFGKFEFDKELFKEVLSFSLWQLFGFSGLYIINFGDNFVIKQFMTTADVGIYNSAYKLFNGLAGLAYIISSYYASDISEYVEKKSKIKLHHFFYRERWFILSLVLFLHIILIFSSEFIINVIYGQRYLKATPILQILLVGSIFQFAGVFYVLYCNTNNKYKKLQFINIIRSFMNIVLDIIFINFFGVVGPAIATVIAIIVTSIIYTINFEKDIYLMCRK